MSIEDLRHEFEQNEGLIKHHHEINPDTEPEYYETEYNLASISEMLRRELGAEATKEAQ